MDTKGSESIVLNFMVVVLSNPLKSIFGALMIDFRRNSVFVRQIYEYYRQNLIFQQIISTYQ